MGPKDGGFRGPAQEVYEYKELQKHVSLFYYILPAHYTSEINSEVTTSIWKHNER